MEDPNACGPLLTERQLILSAIGVGADGLPTLRVVNVADTASEFFSCGQDPETFAYSQLFALDSNNKIALRVSIDGL